MYVYDIMHKAAYDWNTDTHNYTCKVSLFFRLAVVN